MIKTIFEFTVKKFYLILLIKFNLTVNTPFVSNRNRVLNWTIRKNIEQQICRNKENGQIIFICDKKKKKPKRIDGFAQKNYFKKHYFIKRAIKSK